MRLPVNRHLPLAALVLVAACGGAGAPLHDVSGAPQSPYGPAADYPVVVGPAYSVDGVSFTPSDTMNYDVVGRASVGADGGTAVSAAHHTLPLPSYVEVTALDTGKTVLVRVERRGPMAATNTIELSPGAAAQLGLTGQTRAPVRVRRVNPIEPDRAMLRAGQAAPARMDTPKSLLSVLQRKLDQQEGVVRPAPDSTPTPAPSATAAPAPKPAATSKPAPTAKPTPRPKPSPAPTPAPAPKPAPTPAPAPKPAPAAPKPAPAPAAKGSYVLQIGAFSNQANAKAAAAKTGGSVTQSGAFWRVRSGPYGSEAEAKAALAKVRGAGYSDARIQRAN